MQSTLGRMMAVIAISATVAHANDAVSRSFKLEYHASLGETSGRTKMWVPIPQDTEYQTIRAREVKTDAGYRFVSDQVYGNRFVLVESDGSAVDVVLTFDVDRLPRLGAPADGAQPLSKEERMQYLSPSRMVITNGVVREEAVRIAGDAKTSCAKARRLYDHIVDTVRYDKSGKGWGRGDAVYACDVRSGNCTDFHSLFIGEARSLGVPSRFLMGFSVPRDKPSGEIGGYHCWAEFYEDGKGWLPLDASEAFKDKSRREELFGGLDHDRVQFTVGRDIVLPGMKGEPLNFAIYPYVEVDGKPYTGTRCAFRYRKAP